MSGPMAREASEVWISLSVAVTRRLTRAKNLLAILCLLLGACAQTNPRTLAIRSRPPWWMSRMDHCIADQTVLLAGNRIVAVGPAGQVSGSGRRGRDRRAPAATSSQACGTCTCTR